MDMDSSMDMDISMDMDMDSSMDMDMDMQHGKLTCIMKMYLQHGRGQEAWTQIWT
jgi:hypothetical protein